MDTAGYFIDLDSDGWEDFVSVQYGINAIEIFFNNQGEFFEDTGRTNIYVEKPTFSVAATDFDLDGDVDLFMAHWGAAWQEDEPLTGYLWENDGTGHFTDRSNIVDIVPSFRPPPFDDVLAEHSFTPIFADVNGDPYPDLLLASDFEASQVLLNDNGMAFRGLNDLKAISDERHGAAGGALTTGTVISTGSFQASSIRKKRRSMRVA
ncbi:MAG: VCBS repeat-containing protein [Woeseiaceae bacterium]|nr:VCBS repeat-containing protein [Woeseiaceae bacterium]